MTNIHPILLSVILWLAFSGTNHVSAGVDWLVTWNPNNVDITFQLSGNPSVSCLAGVTQLKVVEMKVVRSVFGKTMNTWDVGSCVGKCQFPDVEFNIANSYFDIESERIEKYVVELDIEGCKPLVSRYGVVVNVAKKSVKFK